MADVWEAYRDELEGMERQARTNLDSTVALVNTVAAHILNSGGKRIRPFLLLLSARLCGYTGRDHHQLASLVEFIHTASLLHDDVIDDADIRRGHRTARKVWGNQISILVGDYLYSKAFCHVVDFRNHGINEVLGEACKKMAEGEVLQLYYNGNPSMSETEYLKIVEYKTAGLIAAACRMGAILADASEGQQDALFRFGRPHHKPGIMLWEEPLRQIPIRRRHLCDPGQCQLFGQPVLQGTEGTLRPAPRFRRIGGNE